MTNCFLGEGGKYHPVKKSMQRNMKNIATCTDIVHNTINISYLIALCVRSQQSRYESELIILFSIIVTTGFKPHALKSRFHDLEKLNYKCNLCMSVQSSLTVLGFFKYTIHLHFYDSLLIKIFAFPLKAQMNTGSQIP